MDYDKSHERKETAENEYGKEKEDKQHKQHKQEESEFELDEDYTEIFKI